MIHELSEVTPGIIFLFLGAVIARGMSSVVGLNELLLAIGIGITFTHTVGIPQRGRAGIKTHKIWLAAGIVLLGASLTISDISEIGTEVLILLAGVVLFTLTAVELIARYLTDVTERFGSLLAAGTGICGVSAVVAVGGAVRARKTQIVYAAGVVLLMDAITIIVYPIVGSIFDLSDVVFGVWTGISMLSTGPAIAVGFAYSETAGQWATITKLGRNALIGVVALGYATVYTRSQADSSLSLSVIWANFPKFVFGFLILVILASAGLFAPAQQDSISNAVDWLFLCAFVGLGTEIQIKDLQEAGVIPVAIVFVVMCLTSAVSLSMAVLMF